MLSIRSTRNICTECLLFVIFLRRTLLYLSFSWPCDLDRNSDLKMNRLLAVNIYTVPPPLPKRARFNVLVWRVLGGHSVYEI